ncbi:Ribosome-releasing factor 2, mitochondrial [Exophiala xenobiotica]|uniref:Ribosome-releasing factor 2, mitochondrial n=1 Tax=Lithohypha guttulata TaxID=1690604 RepID=A0ABR0KF22_9EURO|nr:Ribosome-releasing factor 2, mitochondrial [Lithohypha guttulata]KAK5322324.1 Ribosome-releasing factor 2, mitochondrial [Exophiala xenobiotica]
MRIGDVDDGSTVTDFLPAERARGITIQSAAITFNWPPLADPAEDSRILQAVQKQALPRSALSHRINLIDTPGHADFTFEVRRSLRILDGAVCVLDGVAGVEAQTEQVWNQAADWKIPRIAYVNKLDREGAAFGQTVREIGVRLNGWPAVCQVPWFEGGRGKFCGVADVVNLCGMKYEAGGDGKVIERFNLPQLQREEPALAEELTKARAALVELLSEHDEIMVDAFLEAEEDHLAITPAQLLASIRRCLMPGDAKVIPVFAGASFRNIGVQPILDAVNDLLPSPRERPHAEVSINESTGRLDELLEGNMVAQGSTPSKSGKKVEAAVPAMDKMLKGCALAFKVVNDARKGMLVYIRVYSGTIDRNALLYNTNLKQSERATNLLRMYANESVPVQSLDAGQIGVIAGSKYARTGDTLIACNTNKATPPAPLDRLQLRPIHVPPPVFFASIEPNSLKDEKDMHDKLNLLLREDPSLHITQDEDTGQTLISGMGELHLEIARDRLVGDLKANATMGKIAIGYRETLTQTSSPNTRMFDSSARGDVKGKAGCTATAEPNSPDVLDEDYHDDAFRFEQDQNVVVVEAPSLDKRGRPLNDDAVSLPGHLTLSEVQTAFTNGALAALARGPAFSFPLRNIKVVLNIDPAKHIFGSETSYASLTAAARLATISAFREVHSAGGSALMEPVMNVDIAVDDASMGSIIQDVSSSRGGQIVSLGDNEEAEAEQQSSARNVDVGKIYAPKDPFEFGASASLGQQINKPRTVKAKVPLKEMVGYLKHLRSMTGGRGTFTMSVDRFEKMTGQREKALIAELRGGA